MSNKNIIISVVLVIILIGAYVFWGGKRPQEQYVVDPLNATYAINGQSVKLTNGTASVEAAPGSATKIITTIFGQPVAGDLNADGKADAVVMLSQDAGGSGTFFYVAAAINTGQTTVGTNALLLGDRIAPQTLEVNGVKITVNYAERKPGEPMTIPPSVGVSKYFTVQNGSLLESQ